MIAKLSDEETEVAVQRARALGLPDHIAGVLDHDGGVLYIFKKNRQKKILCKDGE